MGRTIHVKLGEYRDASAYDQNDVDVKRGDFVILEADRGSEFGEVVSDVENNLLGKEERPKGKILRVATEGDMKQIENNRMRAKESINTCMRKITDRKLDMRLVCAEYTFDSSKIIFFFTSDGRVDFRILVKDLAKVFRVRIELKQIGVRDKSRIVSGHGVCGRELCCSSFIKDFHALSIKMAKEQGLPLNPSRISGSCGRIKCCMAYEFNVYKEFSKGLPKMGDKFAVGEEKGKIIDINILKRTVFVDMGEGKIVKVAIPKPAGIN